MGLKELEVGIESGSPRVLRLMGKRSSRKDVVKTLRKAFAYGIKVKGFLMVGYPSETKRELDITVQFARQLKAIGGNRIRFSPVIAKAYPGTEMYERYKSIVEHFTDDTLIDLTEWSKQEYPADVLALLKARTRYNAVHTQNGQPVVLSELTGGASLEHVLDGLVRLILTSDART
jgi:radical SAM superfamily enzyme YgiQ (UPF0313 family)